jgi:hypothetical protein
MKKAETKNHHFVPKTYLKNFAIMKDEGFYVNILRKDESSDKIT